MLTLAFITSMNPIEPAIGELHPPFSLILPTRRIHAAKQTYGFILLTSSTPKSALHCLHYLEKQIWIEVDTDYLNTGLFEEV